MASRVRHERRREGEDAEKKDFEDERDAEMMTTMRWGMTEVGKD
jgi:hypothetical protein